KHANPEAVCTDLHNLFGIDPYSVIKISAKLGIGIEEVLIAIIKNLPPPKANREAKEFRALLFDSWYDRYRGALNLVYVSDGKLEMGQEIQHHSTGKTYPVKSLSLLRPNEASVDELKTKVKLYNEIVLPVLIYGSECWAFEDFFSLRKEVIKDDLCPICVNGEWRIRYNENYSSSEIQAKYVM
uniref:Uncharacterized protein n=1 Tax=Megaselia scalaris TaxID=36166 RepID=T1H417_MEGSC